jgi:hypothetical protein
MADTSKIPVINRSETKFEEYWQRTGETGTLLQFQGWDGECEINEMVPSEFSVDHNPLVSFKEYKSHIGKGVDRIDGINVGLFHPRYQVEVKNMYSWMSPSFYDKYVHTRWNKNKDGNPLHSYHERILCVPKECPITDALVDHAWNTDKCRIMTYESYVAFLNYNEHTLHIYLGSQHNQSITVSSISLSVFLEPSDVEPFSYQIVIRREPTWLLRLDGWTSCGQHKHLKAM